MIRDRNCWPLKAKNGERGEGERAGNQFSVHTGDCGVIMSQRLQREHLTMGGNGIVIILCATPFRTQICQKSHTLNRISTNSFPARWRPPAEIRAELVRRGPICHHTAISQMRRKSNLANDKNLYSSLRLSEESGIAAAYSCRTVCSPTSAGSN